MARTALGFGERLLLIPANRSPFKDAIQASFADRLKMLALVRDRLRGEGLAVDLSDAEGRRPPPSYTVETLREIRRSHAGTCALLLGSDSLRDFSGWKDPAEIAANHPMLVAVRQDDADAETSIRRAERDFGATVHRLPVPPGCSSTAVRRSLLERNYDALKDCLEDDVLDYIRAQGLYLNVAH